MVVQTMPPKKSIWPRRVSGLRHLLLGVPGQATTTWRKMHLGGYFPFASPDPSPPIPLLCGLLGQPVQKAALTHLPLAAFQQEALVGDQWAVFVSLNNCLAKQPWMVTLPLLRVTAPIATVLCSLICSPMGLKYRLSSSCSSGLGGNDPP